MAISLDATSGPIATTASSWSHTCSTSAGRKLFVAFTGNVSGTDNITAVTYAGTSLTKVATVQKPSDRLVDLWYLDNPASGTNTVSVTASGFYAGMSASYIGCAAGLDSQGTNTATAASSLTTSTTVVGSNCWILGVLGNNNGAQSAGTGTTVRVNDSANASAIVDSNGIVFTGSQSLQMTRAGSNNWAGIMVSIRPALGAGINVDSAVLSQANATTSNTWSHTTSGTNRLLIVGVQFATGTDISGVPTYNGTSMTLAGSYSLSGSVFNNTYIYYLIAPTTGAHNVVINNTGGANYIYAASASYTGVAQVSPSDLSGAASPTTGTSLSTSLTTTVDNDWIIGYFSGGTSGAALSAGSNTTFRTSPTGGSWNNIGDTNAAQTPAGAHSIAVSAAGSEKLGIYALAIKPYVVAASSFPDLRLAFI